METNGMVAGINVNEFLPGAVVKGLKENDAPFQGEVVAYNREIGWLVIQQQTKVPEKCDVTVLSFSSIKEICVVKEASSDEILPKLCVKKMQQRRTRNLQKMADEVNRLGDGVSEEAQKLFNHIHKTLRDTSWDGQDIVVMQAVVITPPYAVPRLREARAGGGSGSHLLVHVRKVMDQFRGAGASKN